MIPISLDRLLQQQRTMLLQGPMGPFFAELARTLRDHGQTVSKVNFNAGDDHFYAGDEVLAFSEPLSAWPAWLRQHLLARQIDAIVLFGQTRSMHVLALREARALGITAYVFEEGYLRPDFVTLEIGGVNAESSIPRDAAFYRHLNIEPQPVPLPTHQQFSKLAGLAAKYGSELWKGRARYPHYEHHRCMDPVAETARWLWGVARKWKARWQEREMQPWLSAPEQHKRYFLVPLQVHNDSQVLCHSRFASVEAFIVEIMLSFAKHGLADQMLVFKHHPMDRAYRDYRRLIQEHGAALGLSERVHYIHDQHLPTLLQHARGVVTINSTTGLQSLYHATPVLTLGDCFYAVPGMVHAGPLEQFWRDPGTVDRDLFQRFRAHLLRETQLNASFYGETPGLPSSTETSRRLALASSRPNAAPQADNWSAPTLPTLK